MKWGKIFIFDDYLRLKEMSPPVQPTVCYTLQADHIQ